MPLTAGSRSAGLNLYSLTVVTASPASGPPPWPASSLGSIGSSPVFGRLRGEDVAPPDGEADQAEHDEADDDVESGLGLSGFIGCLSGWSSSRGPMSGAVHFSGVSASTRIRLS